MKNVCNSLFPKKTEITFIIKCEISRLKHFQFYNMSVEDVIATVPINAPKRLAACLGFNNIACLLGATPPDYEKPKVIRKLVGES